MSRWKTVLVIKDKEGKDPEEEDVIDIEQELNSLFTIGVNGKVFTVRFHIIGKELEECQPKPS